MGIFDFDKASERKLIVDGDFEYYLDHTTPATWEARKTCCGHLISVYIIRKSGANLYCSCPAGQHGRVCKHAKWVRQLQQS